MSLGSTQTNSDAREAGARLWQVTRTALPLAGLVVVFCIAFFGEQGLMANHSLRLQMADLADEIETLRSSNAALEEQVRRLSDDPGVIEDTIREEMFMVRGDRDELVFAFPEGSPSPPADTGADEGAGAGAR